jgi:putative FmdB family regulatory protein
MPIFEYACRACAHRFEVLVRGTTAVACEKCGSPDLERLLSLPTVRSESTRHLSSMAAKKRDALQATDNMHTQRRYEQSHND